MKKPTEVGFFTPTLTGCPPARYRINPRLRNDRNVVNRIMRFFLGQRIPFVSHGDWPMFLFIRLMSMERSAAPLNVED